MVDLDDNKFLYELGKSIKPLKPEKVVIFGSFVDKGLNAHDIDLLIISNFFSNYFWQDRLKLLDLPHGPFYDVRLFTAAEFESLFPIDHHFRQNLEKHSINLEVYL